MSPNEQDRIVVTGMGVVTPIGSTLDDFRRALYAGRSGVGPITLFDCNLPDPVTGEPQFATRIAAEVQGFSAESLLRKPQRYDRASQFAIVAARAALEDARVTIDDSNRQATGVIAGTACGDMQTVEAAMIVLQTRGARRLLPTYLPKVLPSTLIANVCMFLGAQGPSMGISSACASSTHALGEACWMIRRGDAQRMIVTGAEATITPLTVGSFTAMRAMSRRNDAPQAASRPFDRDRDGFVLGEGAGVLVLETLASARTRNAPIHAEIIGYGASADAYHLTDMNADKAQCAQAMSKALARAGIGPEDVDYVNAHGTSTPTNDGVETAAIKTVLGAHAYQIPISSTKSMIGHLMSGSGAVELIATIFALQDQRVHPTINLENPDTDCDLDYVAASGRPHTVNVAMKNSFGMGGHNATVILRRWSE